MAGGQRPDIRIMAKRRNSDEKAVEVGVGWLDKFGGYNVKVHTEETQWTRPFEEVLDPSEFFINIWHSRKPEEDASAPPTKQWKRKPKAAAVEEEVEELDEDGF